MLRLLIVWLINTLALAAVAYLMPSVGIASAGAAIVAALVLGLVNALIRPLLVLLTLPVTVLTLGLFIFVINGLLFWAVGSVVPRGAMRRMPGLPNRTAAAWKSTTVTSPCWWTRKGPAVPHGSGGLAMGGAEIRR